MKNINNKGFTLIELLLIIVIISALAVTVFAALNPAQRLSDARDARRVTDVDTILSAIHQYIVDEKGSYPTGLSAAGTAETQIGTDASGCAISTGPCGASAAGCVDLGSTLSNYLASIPVDPLGGTTYTAGKTGYTVQVDGSNGIVTVRSCASEGPVDIVSSR